MVPLGIDMVATLAKYLGALAVAGAALFAFVVAFSGVESRFECAGTLTAGDASKPATIYVKLAEYRWWVGLWSKSDGALWLEIPNETVDYFGDVREVGDQLQVYGAEKAMKGNFSTLSKALGLSTPRGFFSGSCKQIDA